jgi:glucose/arabinose dehydrogenase
VKSRVGPEDSGLALPIRRSMSRRFLLTLSVAAVGALALASAGWGGPPRGFEVQTIVSGLETPTALAYAPDGRIFITQKRGLVRVWADGRLHDFLDLRDEVNDYADRGLNNLTVDDRGRVYLFFTEELRKDDPDKVHPAGGRLIRVEALADDPNKADPASRVTLLSGFDSRGPWHSVGGLTFDRQGNLVLGLGDGSLYYPKEITAAALATYDLDSLNGKILRIDPDTAQGVPGNPYYDPARPDTVRSKVIARGVRMPYRITVEPASGNAFVGDVGSDRWEEIDLVPSSPTDPDRQLNFGWPCYEGGDSGAPEPRYPDLPECVSRYYSKDDDTLTVAPQYAYRGDAHAALVLGPLLSGGAFPAGYAGRLVYADFVRDRFWTYRDGESFEFGAPGGWGGPTDVDETPQGTLAYTAFLKGRVNEIVYVGGEGTSAVVLVGVLLAALAGGVILILVLRRRSPGRIGREAILLALLGFAAVFFAYRWAVFLDRPGIPGSEHPEGWRFFHDQGYYLLEAQALGGLHVLSHELFLYGPGYPILAAPFANIGDFGWPYEDPFLIADGAIWLLTVAATFLVARRLYGEIVGAAAVLALMLATPLVDNVVLPWNSTASLGALAVTMLVALERRPRWWHGALLGGAIAWAYSARYVDAVWIVIAVLAILLARGQVARRGLPVLAALAAAALIASIPTFYLQWRAFDSPFRTSYSATAANPVTSENFDLADIVPHALQTFVSPWLFSDDGARSDTEPLLSSMFLLLLAPVGAWVVARRWGGARRILVVGYGAASLLATLFYLSYYFTGSEGLGFGAQHFFKMWWPLWTIAAVAAIVEGATRLVRRESETASSQPVSPDGALAEPRSG